MAKTFSFEWKNTHRLISQRFADGDTSINEGNFRASFIPQLRELSSATSDQALAERGKNLDIIRSELVWGVPEASVINSAFCRPGVDGARLNTPRRGAWYAGIRIGTSLREVAYHKVRALSDSGVEDEISFDYRTFRADFNLITYRLDPEEQEVCLRPKPVPACYAPGQALAESLRLAGGTGIVYPSVRHHGGTCFACFHPQLIANVRRGGLYRITIKGSNFTYRPLFTSGSGSGD